METFKVFEFGMFVTMGVDGEMAGVPEDSASPACGLGISTIAMKGGTGVACAVLVEAQLENNSAHKDKTKRH